MSKPTDLVQGTLDLPRLLGMALRESLVLVGVGTVIGAAGAVAIMRLLAGRLFGIGVHDPATFAGAIVLVFVVSSMAVLLPARRAGRSDGGAPDGVKCAWPHCTSFHNPLLLRLLPRRRPRQDLRNIHQRRPHRHRRHRPDERHQPRHR
jgi:hypothetical protein